VRREAGEAMITSKHDVSRVARRARAAKLRTAGPWRQLGFPLELGVVDARGSIVASASSEEVAKFLSELDPGTALDLCRLAVLALEVGKGELVGHAIKQMQASLDELFVPQEVYKAALVVRRWMLSSSGPCGSKKVKVCGLILGEG